LNGISLSQEKKKEEREKEEGPTVFNPLRKNQSGKGHHSLARGGGKRGELSLLLLGKGNGAFGKAASLSMREEGEIKGSRRKEKILCSRRKKRKPRERRGQASHLGKRRRAIGEEKKSFVPYAQEKENDRKRPRPNCITFFFRLEEKDDFEGKENTRLPSPFVEKNCKSSNGPHYFIRRKRKKRTQFSRGDNHSPFLEAREESRLGEKRGKDPSFFQ